MPAVVAVTVGEGAPVPTFAHRAVGAGSASSAGAGAGTCLLGVGIILFVLDFVLSGVETDVAETADCVRSHAFAAGNVVDPACTCASAGAHARIGGANSPTSFSSNTISCSRPTPPFASCACSTDSNR